eukprot:TRINITY_DN838_c1_g1_i1.p1 TRINITY_DN838_c1_g1~~TRINITY_DN838_c1_g1_i1.p1  ORF type:complete len:1031 (+),score=322.40 TRINITY_DN838_c1_g1_i1:152-3244(+)
MKIRRANVLTIFGVVTLAVSITLGISIYISDRALEDVKNHQDDAVAECFAEGLDSVVDNSKLLLLEKSKSLVETVRTALHETERAHTAAVLQLRSIPSAEADDYSAYNNIPSALYAAWVTNEIPLIGWLHTTGIGSAINYHPHYVREVRTPRDPNATLLLVANDTSHPDLAYRGTILNGAMRRDIPCLDPNFSFYDGRATGECPFEYDLASNHILKDALTSTPTNTTFWTPLLGFETWAGLVIMTAYSSFDAPAIKQGLAYTGFQLGVINIATTNVSATGRNFVVTGLGILIGASNGATTLPTVAEDPLTGNTISVTMPIPANSSEADPVISNITAVLLGAGTTANPFADSYNRAQKDGGAEELYIPHINETMYVSVTPVNTGAGLDWWAVLSVKKELIVGGLNTRKISAERAISDSNGHVRTRLRRDRGILFAVVVAASMLSVGAAWYATKKMLAPLDILKMEMGEVAHMNLHGVIEDREKSVFEEINSMQTSFLQMLTSLKEYRQYMPQAIVDLRTQEHNFDTEDESDDSTDEEKSNPETEAADRGNSQSSSDPANSQRIFSGVEFHREGTGYVESLPDDSTGTSGSITMGKSDVFDSIKASPVGSSIMTQRNSGGALKKKNFSSVHLTRKRGIAQVCFSCRDFDEFVKRSDTAAVLEFHTKWLQCILVDAKDLGGTVERFVGDVVDVNFGGLVPCTQSAAKAANYVLKVRDRMSVANLSQEGFDGMETEMACGVASGVALVGNLGVQGLKTPSILGRTVFICKAMTAISREMGLDIIVDQRFADEIRGSFRYLPVDILRLNDNGKKQSVYHLMNTRHATTGEWMYTLESGNETAYEKVWKQFKTMSDKGGSLLQIIEMLNVVVDEPVAKVVASRLKGYHDEVLAATGKPSVEYSRVYKAKGSTICAPEAVRKVSNRMIKSNGTSSSHSKSAHRTSESTLSKNLSSSGNMLVTPGAGSFGLRSKNGSAHEHTSPNFRSVHDSDSVVSPHTQESPSVTSILEENFPILPSATNSQEPRTPKSPSIKRLR